MTSLKQIEANRLNALKSTGPTSEQGKMRSRRNAVRHGLTAETVIDGLEDPEDYKAFEAAVTADYDAQTAVERELVLRLASLLWRLRRAHPLKPVCCRAKAKFCVSSGRDSSLRSRMTEPANDPRSLLPDTKSSEPMLDRAISGTIEGESQRDNGQDVLRRRQRKGFRLPGRSRASFYAPSQFRQWSLRTP